MTEVPIDWPKTVDAQQFATLVEEAIAASGLRISLRGTLKQWPGCVHWHVRQGRGSGTLEITVSPEEHRAWFSIQDGRRADWIDAQLAHLRTAIRQGLRRRKRNASS